MRDFNKILSSHSLSITTTDRAAAPEISSRDRLDQIGALSVFAAHIPEFDRQAKHLLTCDSRLLV